MKWRVTGISKSTGHDLTKVIEAPDKEVAIAWASQSGMMVSDAALDSSPPDYRPQMQTPDYTGLQIAGTTLRVFALLSYIGGALLLFATVINNQSLALLAVLAPLVSCFFVGAILHGLGSMCDAVRDIARNSFRQAN